ncbi:MAG TPA: AI-2E family transporter [Candidatus Magasanikbacteria bacterium]|nr:AI-2E family transporter [Candidatus Magasanikbacteria bacterium]
MAEIKVNITAGSIAKFFVSAILMYLVYLLSDVLVFLFVAIVLSTLIEPFANAFERRRIPRAIAVLVVYILFFGIITAVVSLLAPIIIEDTPQLIANLQNTWGKFIDSAWWDRITGFGVSGLADYDLTSAGANTLTSVYARIVHIFGGLVSMIIVLVMTFYLSIQRDPIKKILTTVLPESILPRWLDVAEKMKEKMGRWIRGQLILSLIMGVLVFCGLKILGIKYALVLGLFIAILEFIPYVGPILASLPAMFIAFSDRGITGLLTVMVLYVVIQQSENHLIVPKVMQKAVGLNPIVSIVAVLSGAKLAGVLGALVAIPVATALSVLLQHVLEKKSDN